jgi:hypothetical protein
MSQDGPSPPLPDAPPVRAVQPNLLDVAFDAMFLDTSSVPPDNFSDEWGSTDTEEAVTLSSVDDARLKDCIVVGASASVWGVPVMCPSQLEAFYRLPHPPHLPNSLVVVHRTGGGGRTHILRTLGVMI